MADPLYSDDYLRNQAKVEEQIRLRSANMINIDATEAQRVLRLKGQTGLPEQLLYDNLDDIEEQVRLKEFNPAKYKETAPAWQKFASENPFNLAVLKEDEKNLTRLERAWRPISMASEQSWAEQEVGMLGIKRREQGGELDEADQAKMEELKKYTVDHDFNANMVQKPIVWLTRQSANMIGSWKTGAARATVLAPIGASVGFYTGGTVFPVVGAVPGMMAGWSAGMTAGFIEGGFEYSRDIEGGHAYHEFRDLGFEHDDAAWASHLTGNINGVFEAASGSFIFSKLPGVPAFRRSIGSRITRDILTRPTVQAAIRKGAKDYSVQMVGELGTEIAQESTNMAFGEILKLKNNRTDFLTREEVGDRIADIATETFKAMFLLAGAGPGVRMIYDSKRANEANLRALAFESMGESASDSTLRKNLPDKFQEFVDLVTKDGPIQSILVPVEEFDKYWQGQAENPDEIAASLGVKNLEEARLYGSDVQIPVGEFADKIAPNKHLAGLTPHLRTNENQMTQAEAQEWEKIKPQLAEEMEAALAETQDQADGPTLATPEQEAALRVENAALYEAQDNLEKLRKETSAINRRITDEGLSEELDAEWDAADDAVKAAQKTLAKEEAAYRERADKRAAEAKKAKAKASPNQQIADEVAADLTNINTDAKAAKVQGRIYAALLATAAANAGVDPMVLHNQRYGGVKKELPAALAGKDIDMDLDPLLDQIRGRDFPTHRQIYGKSLFDLIREHGGIQDQGGELSARDLQKDFPGLVSKTGMTIDGMAEIAYDQGYISEYDSELFMEALDLEHGGAQQFGRAFKTNQQLEELLGKLEEAENFLETEGIDIQVLTNAEVRKYLKGVKTLEQSSDTDLEKWSDMVVMLAAQQDRLAAEKNLRTDAYGEIDTILARAEALRPRLAANQDFKDVTFTDKFVDRSGKTGTSKISAQASYETAVEKRNLLKRLLDCVNG